MGPHPAQIRDVAWGVMDTSLYAMGMNLGQIWRDNDADKMRVRTLGDSRDRAMLEVP